MRVPRSGERPIQAILDESMQRMRAFWVAEESEIARVKSCPQPCTDGKVCITPPGFPPRRMACPLVSGECAYGGRIEESLNRYLRGLALNVGVPQRHVDNLGNLDKFGKPKETTATDAVYEWVRHPRGFLVLMGVPGVGKSFGAAYGVFWYLRLQIRNWLGSETWSDAAKAAGGIAWFTAKEIVDDKSAASRARSVPLLILDDFGKEDDTKTGIAAVRDVICKRYDCKLPSITTSELGTLDIRNRYGQYIAERLVEDSATQVIECGGESMRLMDDENVGEMAAHG